MHTDKNTTTTTAPKTTPSDLISKSKSLIITCKLACLHNNSLSDGETPDFFCISETLEVAEGMLMEYEEQLSK